jgi:aldehyde dehydrogenase (NAD+)
MMNIGQLEEMRRFFQLGSTHSYEFRITQLKRLKDALLSNEKELFAALQADLRKSPEESWVTEIGMVIAEINVAISRLKKWMKPRRVATNLLNLPSRSYILPEPLGVVLIIGPWNYPVQLLLNPLVGAIAAGNCSVLKPSEFTPAVNGVIRKIISEKFPPGYISFVEGEGSAVIPPILKNFTFDHIFFTGSNTVGKEIYKMAAERLVPVTLELGGKSPCIVEEDANIKVAARRIAVTKFSNAGQMCVAPDFVLVHEKRKSEFLSELQKSLLAFFGEDALESYSYCRIINRRQFDRLRAYGNSGKIVFGGRSDEKRLLMEPTVVTDVVASDALMNEEIFGPILPVISFTSREQALAIINRHPDPLSFYIYTSDSRTEKEWMKLVPAGGTCINNSSWHLTNHNLPFGGRGNSGTGHYHGKYSFETFSHLRAVMKTPTWFDPNIKYPPFKGRLNLFKKVIR